MPLTTAAVGSYPKPPHEGRPFQLRRAIAAFEKGEIDERQLRAVEDNLVEEVIGEQAAAGIDLVTDGQVRWTDGQTAFARRIEGFATSHEDLIRYFDNNTYYRRPHVTGPVDWKGPITTRDWIFASSVTDLIVKQVITGPYTLAKLSKNLSDATERELVLDLAGILNREALELEAAGCSYLQFDEPAIVNHPNTAGESKDFSLLAEASAILTAGLSATTEIRTFFGEVEESPAEFFALPFHVFGLDLVDGGGNWRLIEEFPPDRLLSAGLLNGRDTRLESLDALAAQVDTLVGRVAADRLHISTSCGLEYLPRDRAEAKIKRLAQAAGSVREGAR